MYRQRVLVKSLQIVETFNAVSVIATDKTGTLTQNKMTVTHLLWDTQGVYKVPLIDPELPKPETIFQTIRRLSQVLSIQHVVYRWALFQWFEDYPVVI